jgi:hypothetical protein
MATPSLKKKDNYLFTSPAGNTKSRPRRTKIAEKSKESMPFAVKIGEKWPKTREIHNLPVQKTNKQRVYPRAFPSMDGCLSSLGSPTNP